MTVYYSNITTYVVCEVSFSTFCLPPFPFWTKLGVPGSFMMAFIHIWLTSCTLTCLILLVWSSRRERQISWACLPFKIVFCTILPSWSLNKPTYASSEVQCCSFVICFSVFFQDFRFHHVIVMMIANAMMDIHIPEQFCIFKSRL